jgi:hypothetical protein
MKNDDEILQSLIAGGVIGAAMGTMLTQTKEDGVIVGALIGAAILGTFKANQKANETHMTMIIEENGKLYQINTNGTKQFLRDIEKPSVKLQENFKLI